MLALYFARHRAGGEGRAFITQRRGGARLLLRARSRNNHGECLQKFGKPVWTPIAPAGLAVG